MNSPEKIKIAFVIDTIEQIGGTEQQLILLLEHLDRRKFEPYLICLQDSDWLRQQKDKWPVYTVRFRSLYYPVSYWRIVKLSRFFKKEAIDIVQTYFRDANIVGILAARLAGIRKIVSSRRNQGYWHTRFELNLLKLVNPLVERFLANTQAIKTYVNQSEKVPLEKIDVIYNAIDVSRFREAGRRSRESLYRELKMDPSMPIVTIVANLRPVKAIDDLIKAARRVRDHNPQVQFLIIGEGPEKEKLLSLAAGLELKANIHLLGTRNDIADLLAISDIGVLCSESEGMSNAVLEYMAAALPVVVTDIDGNRELIENQINGRLVPVHEPQALAEALIHLLEDPAGAAQMGQRSLQKISADFQLENVIKKSEDYYSTL